MTTIFFQAVREDGRLIGPECRTLAEAVDEAMSYDGYGTAYQRTADGVMHVYSSQRHIGNNDYHPHPADVWPWPYESDLADDVAAMAEICAKLHAQASSLHSRYRITIDEMAYEGDTLVAVNGEPVEAQS